MMKNRMKAFILPLLIAMFVWGCGASEPAGPLEEINNGSDCDAQKLCEAEGFDFAIDACTEANSQPPMVCETFDLCGKKVACHSKEGKKDENNNNNNNNSNCDDKIECPDGTYQVDTCNDGAIEDDCSVVSICNERLFCVKGEEPECEDKPVCPSDFEQTDQCPQDDVICQEVSLCGITIQCWKESKNECADGAQCPEGMVEVPRDQCGTNTDGTLLECKEVTACEETIFCVEEDCSKDPVCPDGSDPLSEEDCEKLRVGGLECVEVNSCDKTILCVEDKNTCQAEPECPADSFEIDKEKCGIDESGNEIECFPVTECEKTIMCTKIRVDCIVPPECPAGSFEVEIGRCEFDDPTAANYCTIVEECGVTLYCIDNNQQCDAIPSCPAGMDEVLKCQNPDDPDSCQKVELCGRTIFCESNRM